MGNRQGRKSEQDGQVVERSGSKRGSGRKKKKEADKIGGKDGVDSNQKNKNANDGSKKPDGKPEVKIAVVDGGQRPKMGRLSGSFAAGDTRTSRNQNFPALDDRGPSSGGPGKSAEVKIYRSYSTLATEPPRLSMFDGQPSLANVKIYRRAPEAILSASSRAASLPRGFGRTSRSAFTEPSTPTRTMAPQPSNGSVVRGRGISLDWDDKRMSAGPAVRSATMPRLHNSFSAMSSAPGGYRVKTDDFPDTDSIRRKLKQFESALVRSILVKFSRLSAEDQLLTVPVVIRSGRTNRGVLTLRDYLEFPNSIPDDVVDISAATGEYVLCIPPAMFTGMAHFRRERSADRAHWPTLARDVVTCVTAEAAAEISRMFEYQVALLTGETSIGLLAEHCAERIMAFVLGDLQVPRFDCNTVVQGAVRGKRPVNPQNPAAQTPLFISVIIGMKELKWNLFEVFDKPGLRKAVLLVHDSIPAPGDDDRCPWKFYTTSSADPMLYGYRGQMVEWDFLQGCYRLNPFDEASFREEMSWRYDDFHRLYPPYRRLFGARAMRRYYTEQARPGARPLTLDRFLLQAVHGAAYTRDAIQPVYRPLEPFTLAERDGVDLSSADVPRVLLPRKGGVAYEGYRRPVTPGGDLEVFSPSTTLVPMYSPRVVDLNSSTVSEPPWLGGGRGYTTVVEEVTTVHAHKASHV